MTLAERDIREKRAKVFEGMKPIMEKLGQGVGISDSERTEFDKRSKELRKLDKDLSRIQEYNGLAAGREEARDARADAAPVITGDNKAEKLYENAFLRFLQDGHTDGMTTEERQVFRVYSSPQVVNRPPTTNRYEQFTDTHGVRREVGYEMFRTSDIKWDEQRAVLDANALSTAPNSAGVAAGATGFDAGYMVPQGQRN